MRGLNRFTGSVVTAALLLILTIPAGAIVTQQWDFHCSGPSHGLSPTGDLNIDSGGNVYIAGSLWKQGYPTYRFYAIKFNPAGDTVWTSTFSAPGTSMSIATDMTGDLQGNVYVTGWCEMSGQIYNYLTVKFNSSGQQQWYATYNGPANYIDQSQAIAIDQIGYVYVTGYSYAGGDYDYATIKYSPQGEQMWVARYTSPTAANDQAVDLAVDGEGNVYVTGTCGTDWSNYDVVTVKYNAQGQQQWIATFDGATHSSDSPLLIKTDAQGYIYVIGKTTNSNYIYDYLTLKYDSSGSLQWEALYDTPQNGEDVATDLVIDTNGDVVVTGFTTGWGINTIRYTAGGATRWIQHHGYFYIWGYHNAGIALDAHHNIYVTSSEGLLWDDRNCATYKYNYQGDLQWIARYDFDLCCEGGSEVANDAQGNVLVTGDFLWPEYENKHPFLIKYNQPSGEFTADMIPAISPVQIPSQGGNFNYTLHVYNTVQNTLRADFWWRLIYPDSTLPTPLTGPVRVILPLDSTSWVRTQRIPGNVPAGTYQYILNAGQYPDLIWACDTIPVTKLIIVDEAPIDWALSASPNPFNPSTDIRYQIQDARYVSLRVYDIAGRLVATLAEGRQESGTHQVTFDGSKLASGLYFVRMEAGEFTSKQKLILIK
jgi:hypothetical protein